MFYQYRVTFVKPNSKETYHAFVDGTTASEAIIQARLLCLNKYKEIWQIVEVFNLSTNEVENNAVV